MQCFSIQKLIFVNTYPMPVLIRYSSLNGAAICWKTEWGEVGGESWGTSPALTEVCHSWIHDHQINPALSALSVRFGGTHNTSLVVIFAVMCYCLPLCFASTCLSFNHCISRVGQEFGSPMGFRCDAVFSGPPMGGMGRDWCHLLIALVIKILRGYFWTLPCF